MHAYFEADVFKGYVLTVKLPFKNESMKFEVFFKSLQNERITLRDRQGSVKYSNSAQDLLFDSVMQLKVKKKYSCDSRNKLIFW